MGDVRRREREIRVSFCSERAGMTKKKKNKKRFGSIDPPAQQLGDSANFMDLRALLPTFSLSKCQEKPDLAQLLFK